MELQVGVKILLKNKENEYLVLFRNNYKPQAGVYWDIPGGIINVGFSLLENLKREVMEETGLEIKDEIKLICAQDILNKYKDKHVVRLTYVGFADGNVKLSHEHTEYKWLTLKEILSLDSIDQFLKETLTKFKIE